MNIYFKPTHWKALVTSIVLLIFVYAQKMFILLGLEYEFPTKPHCTVYLSSVTNLLGFIESIQKFYLSFLVGGLSFLFGSYDICYSTNMSLEINVAQILYYCTALAAAYILSCTVVALYGNQRTKQKK